MTVVVPSEEVGLESLVEEMDEATWLDLVDGLEEVEDLITVHLPRFELEYERLLTEDLKALGMADAFDPDRADFSRMARDARTMQLHVDRVKQKTFVAVDEEGTVAAAATSVGIRPTSAPPTLRADRPFLFAIRERLSGTILFVGTLALPPEA